MPYIDYGFLRELAYSNPKKAKRLQKKLQKKANKEMKVLTFLLKQL
jgi:hypothetical protein